MAADDQGPARARPGGGDARRHAAGSTRRGRHVHRSSRGREVDLRGGRAHPARARVPRPGGPRLLLLDRERRPPRRGPGALQGHARRRIRRPDGGATLLGRGRRQRPLGLAPARREHPSSLRVHLNEWVRFTKPGTYRLVVESTRLERYSREPAPAVVSRPITLHVETATPEWAAAEVARADRGPRGAGPGQFPRGGRDPAAPRHEGRCARPGRATSERVARTDASTASPASSRRRTARRSWRPWRRASTPAIRRRPASFETWRSCAPFSTARRAPMPSGSSNRRP